MYIPRSKHLGIGKSSLASVNILLVKRVRIDIEKNITSSGRSDDAGECLYIPVF